jgi:hypothetical protein
MSYIGTHKPWSRDFIIKFTSYIYAGNRDGNHGNKVAILSDHNSYDWFTDDYLLASKNSSELYIMPASVGTPLPITDYFKPSQFFSGYRGGYGGL